jgi:acetyl-CoA synthetase
VYRPDIGWITGHSYVVYGPLANGATVFLYEGAPNFPQPDRWWKMIDDHHVSILYTAPTAIRTFIRWGEQHPRQHDLGSLRLLGSVGEPINPEAWMWYHEVIGKGRCPIVDTWWQTETGAIMITPVPGVVPTKPGSATRPFFGVVPDVVGRDGVSVGPEGGGLLVLRQPWPAMFGRCGVTRSLREELLERYPELLFHRRWRPARCGRLFLDHGARRRA